MEQLWFGQWNIQDQLTNFNVYMTLMKSGDNWMYRSKFLVQIGLKVAAFTSCTACGYQKRQAVIQTYQCSVWRCYVYRGHSCTETGESLLQVRMALLLLCCLRRRCCSGLSSGMFSLSDLYGPYQVRALQSYISMGKDCLLFHTQTQRRHCKFA